MRIVVPVSASDIDRLSVWSEVVRHLKCGTQHDLTFVASPSVAMAAEDAKADLLGYFNSISVYTIPVEPMGGWPIAPNNQFWHCANAMAKNPSIPWLLCELDCLPIRANAFDAIAAQYVSSGTQYFGFVGKTPWRHDNGKIAKSMYGDSDVMMSGCGVYPGTVMSDEKTSPLMADFMRGMDSCTEPWDAYMRFAMRQNGLGHTELIGNMWNTRNYRVEGGYIFCDASETHEIFDKNPEWEIRKCGGKVHPDAVMIHGCKDDSLQRMILDGEIPAPIYSTKVAKKGDPAQDQKSGEVAELRQTVDQLKDMFMQFMKQSQEKSEPVAIPFSSPVTTGTPAPIVTITTSDSYDAEIETILNYIPAGRKIKLSNLADYTQIPLNRLRAIITDSDKFAPISGPAGWVGRAEPVNA